MPRTSEEIRLKIIDFHHQNWSIYAISKRLGLFTSTMTRIIQRYKQNATVAHRKSPRRPRGINQKKEKLVIRAAKNTVSSLRKTSTEISFPKASSTIRNIFSRYSLPARVCPKKSLWSPEIDKILEFCRESGLFSIFFFG